MADSPPPAATRTPTDKLLNVPGTVAIGDRLLTVASLSLREERALWSELCDLATADANPFQRIAPVLAQLERDKKHVERNVLLEAAARATLNAEPVSDGVLDRARRTVPAVLVRELYRRSRKFHPELQEDELAAVVTATNVGELWFALEAALGVERDDPKATR